MMFKKLLFSLGCVGASLLFLSSRGMDRRLDAQPSNLSTYSIIDTLKPAASLAKRALLLEELLRVLPEDNSANGRVSFLDKTFRDWLERTGELPPDFDLLPSRPFLTNPLLNETSQTIILQKGEWLEKRDSIKRLFQHYVTGTFPDPPENMDVEIIEERKEGEVTFRTVLLRFGPALQAELTVELIIPPGSGPFPVFMTQWNHREWAQIAVKRGYMACIYAGADSKDDTEKYSEIWAGQYDFTRLMRRAYGASRAVDYLHTLPVVDKQKIGITGHSRNGKQSLLAAAFDERIKAVVTSSGGSGAEVPWRYASHQYDVEDIALLTTAQPAWFHPRLRFFIGREDKLPIDQHDLMALVAPRGLMLSTALSEGASNPWGAEQAYFAARGVYEFYDDPDNISMRFRNGLHGTSARDIEDYVDFFDFIFGRSEEKPENELYYDYSFQKWKNLSGEDVDPSQFPINGNAGILLDEDGQPIHRIDEWKNKREDIKEKIQWMLGEPPSLVKNEGPKILENGGRGEDYFGNYLSRPKETKTMGRMNVTPYKGFGDYLYGYLYYPKDWIKEAPERKLPVFIYLHEYDYSKGFSSMGYDHQIQPFFESLIEQGYAVFAFDMLGFGNRIQEAKKFYQRYPHWSKMGAYIQDVRSAVDALENMEIINPNQIYTLGYSLGGTVATLSAALDQRIAGVATVAGFQSLRSEDTRSNNANVKMYSHLHGTIPKLGFFLNNEKRIPFDYHEVMALIAPRPLLVLAPQMDRNNSVEEVENMVDQAEKVYQLYNEKSNIKFKTPVDYNRFSEKMREEVYQWIKSINRDEVR